MGTFSSLLAIVGAGIIAVTIFYLIKFGTNDSRAGRFISVIASILSFFGYLSLIGWASDWQDSIIIFIIIWVAPYILILSAYVSKGKKKVIVPKKIIISDDWVASIIANNDPSDYITNKDLLDKMEPVYFHISVDSKSLDKIRAKYVIYDPNGGEIMGAWKELIISGFKGYVKWNYNNPKLSLPGDLNIKIYDVKNNHLIGNHTVELQ